MKNLYKIKTFEEMRTILPGSELKKVKIGDMDYDIWDGLGFEKDKEHLEKEYKKSSIFYKKLKELYDIHSEECNSIDPFKSEEFLLRVAYFLKERGEDFSMDRVANSYNDSDEEMTG